MLHDHIIPKPSTMGAYASHQVVEQLTSGGRRLYADLGDRLIVRAPADLTSQGKPMLDVAEGDTLCFELVASCGTKCKGKHRYFRKGDHNARREWLERKAEQSGFEVRAVSATSRSEKIHRHGKTISIDRTQFTGVLRVTDADAFRHTLEHGVSGPAKAFGRGMIRLS